MKGFVIGVMGIGATGTVAVMGSGGGGPNDFISQVNKPPQAVYAAFSAIAPEGVTAAPSVDGWGARIEQRITKVPNEQVKLELILDGEALVTAEVQFAPGEGDGTRLAAEFDFNHEVLEKVIAESGEAVPVPELGFSEFMIDQLFAQAMAEMVRKVEKGESLQSLAATHAQWGSGRRGDNISHAAAYDRARSAWRQHQAVQPQMTARPQLDASGAARPGQPRPFPGPATSPAGRPQLNPNQSARPVQPAIRPSSQGGW